MTYKHYLYQNISSPYKFILPYLSLASIYLLFFRSPFSNNKPSFTISFKNRLVVDSAKTKICRASLFDIEPYSFTYLIIKFSLSNFFLCLLVIIDFPSAFIGSFIGFLSAFLSVFLSVFLSAPLHKFFLISLNSNLVKIK